MSMVLGTTVVPKGTMPKAAAVKPRPGGLRGSPALTAIGGIVRSNPPVARTPAGGMHRSTPYGRPAVEYDDTGEACESTLAEAVASSNVPLGHRPNPYLSGSGNGVEEEIADEAVAAVFESTDDLMTGVVKTWHEERGFGFITADGGEDDVFVHRSVLKDGASLVVGCPVFFDLIYEVERKGFKATKVIGAVEALLTAEDAEAALEGGDPKEGGKGKKGKGVRTDPFYRPSFVDDPWICLYTIESEHLKAYLGDEADRLLQRVARHADGDDKGKGKGKGKDKGKDSKDKGKDKANDKGKDKGKGKKNKDRKIEKETVQEPEAIEALAAVAKMPEAKVVEKLPATSGTDEKGEPKAPVASTSIYDFFNDDEDDMMM